MKIQPTWGVKLTVKRFLVEYIQMKAIKIKHKLHPIPSSISRTTQNNQQASIKILKRNLCNQMYNSWTNNNDIIIIIL